MRKGPARPWSALIAAAALAVATVTGISACSSSTPAGSAASSTLTATGRHLTASEFSTAVKEPGTIVLDVRTPAEFASGHLPQSRNIDIQGPDFATQISALSKSEAYAVYCRSGSRSGMAMEQMAAAGFTHIYDLTGGIGAWEGMGGSMVMGGS